MLDVCYSIYRLPFVNFVMLLRQACTFVTCYESINQSVNLINDILNLDDSDAIVEWLEALPLLGLRIHAPVYLLTLLLTQNNQCPLRLTCDLVSCLFSE